MFVYQLEVAYQVPNQICFCTESYDCLPVKALLTDCQSARSWLLPVKLRTYLHGCLPVMELLAMCIFFFTSYGIVCYGKIMVVSKSQQGVQMSVYQ